MARTKYILIDRPEYHTTAVSPAVLADMHARGEVVTSERPVSMAEIKRERLHVWQDAHYFEYMAALDWKRRAHNKTFKAVVQWFNILQGCGSVYVPELDASLAIWACNIKGKRTLFPETACVFYMEGDEIDVRLEVFPGTTFVIGLTQGYPDNEKWEALDQSKLAFRCDDSGQAVTGLLA